MNERNGCNPSTGSFREVVNCSVDRIYDSCYDKDCLEDLPVCFTNCSQNIIDNAIACKFKKCEIVNVIVNVEPIPYNCGFYAVDITFFFHCWFECFTCMGDHGQCVEGLAIYNKKVILYGSEGDSMIFTSQYSGCCNDCTTFSTNMPKATVETVQPIALSARLLDICDCPHHLNRFGANIPAPIAERFEGNFNVCDPRRVVLATIGLFSIVSISRKVSLVVPACGFGVPLKECVGSDEDPCELFYKIQFPTDQFFPPRMSENNNNVAPTGCSCNR
ncbi:MAG TPA: hypothetical protein PK629_05795 [Oscillospiraceae bacterium]|nr:hypothetical protein [Oscillospiraceae bacterium]HPK34468.1 hypothetical protein [Oscillospiraceae bacterium]HPR76294.1 hypothetical protein [Oscillospiraceae bacterium]